MEVMQLVVVDKVLVQALAQYLTKQPLGEVLGLWQGLQQALVRAETASKAGVEKKDASPPPPSPKPLNPAE